ncbi:hypothetical protein [Acinetobacter sp. ANC 4640]
MAICIGGEFDVQDIQIQDVKSIMKMQNPETGKVSLYRLQPIIKGDDHYNFWFSDDIDFGDAMRIVEQKLKGK